MAQVRAPSSERVYQIRQWRGVNEAPEGEAALRMGEAAAMRNFRVTAGGALRKRPGSRDVAGLMAAYHVVADDTAPATLLTEHGASAASLPMTPRARADSVGVPVGDGDETAVTLANAEACAGYYYQPADGALHRFAGCVHTARRSEGEQQRRFGAGLPYSSGMVVYFCQYDTVSWDGAAWTGTNARVVSCERGLDVGAYLIADGDGSPAFLFGTSGSPPEIAAFEARYNAEGRFHRVVRIDRSEFDIEAASWWSYWFTTERLLEARYDWRFFPTYAVSNDADSEVRGLWAGFVAGREVLCAACNGYLWELERAADGSWSKAGCGAVDTAADVHMFGFEEKLYLLNGTQYKVWDGTTLADVGGYRPLVSVSVVPTGGGTALEQANRLTGARRCRFSPDGRATVFTLPEAGLASVDYVRRVATGEALTGWTADLAAGTVTFSAAPAEGVNSLEVGWTYPTNEAASVRAMRFSELYNGAQDSRIFLYGDGTNACLYSGLDYDGRPRADYFPELNVAHIGDGNTPLMAMIRHYDRLLAFKLDSAWSLSYDAITLADGAVTAGFYVTPVNRDVGCCAPGQAALVENRPRTLDGRSVVEWKATSSSGNVNADQRNAERVSQRVDATIRSFDLGTAKTFYDKYAHEYYVIGAEGTALVQGIDADAWYVYTGFAARCLISYKDELYFGTAAGTLRHVSERYPDDAGEAIDAYWESGAMAFEADFKRKYSAMLWVGIRPEANGHLEVTAETDRKSDFAVYACASADAAGVPEMTRLKLKAKKFTYYKLILRNHSADTTATVVSVDLRVRGTGYVR